MTVFYIKVHVTVVVYMSSVLVDHIQEMLIHIVCCKQ